MKEILAGLIADYRQIIEQFEKQECPHSSSFVDCCGAVDKYLNDIFCRREIKRLIDQNPEIFDKELHDALTDLDHRLIEMQQSDQLMILGTQEQYPFKEFFWLYGPLRGMRW